MSEIVFIAGGPWQKPFVQYLKNKGHFIIIVNPVVTDTTLLCDYHIKTDINNLSEINKHIKKFKPIFITSDQSDISTSIVAELSEKWNLPGNSIKTIKKFTNKFEIYNFSKSIEINVPETKIVNNTNEIIEFIKSVGLPIIIKPTDATNSRGFHKINSLEKIDEILSDSMHFSKSKQIIAQKFIPGFMITLEGVCSGGKHKTIATSRKYEYFKPGINSDICYPSNLSSHLLKKIIDTNDFYVESTKIEFGLTHSEYIIDKDQFYLIEIGARGGGIGIADKIVPWVSGINNYDILYHSLIGEIIDVKSLSPLERPAKLKYYEKIYYDEQKIKQIQGVADFQYNFTKKQYIKNPDDPRHSMGIYLAESKEKLNEIEEKVEEIINPNVVD